MQENVGVRWEVEAMIQERSAHTWPGGGHEVTGADSWGLHSLSTEDVRVLGGGKKGLKYLGRIRGLGRSP